MQIYFTNYPEFSPEATYLHNPDYHEFHVLGVHFLFLLEQLEGTGGCIYTAAQFVP